MRKLGTKQRGVLRAIRDHGRWYRGCGWVWGATNETEKLLQALVARQLVLVTDELWQAPPHQRGMPPRTVTVYRARPQLGEQPRKETE